MVLSKSYGNAQVYSNMSVSCFKSFVLLRVTVIIWRKVMICDIIFNVLMSHLLPSFVYSHSLKWQVYTSLIKYVNTCNNPVGIIIVSSLSYRCMLNHNLMPNISDMFSTLLAIVAIACTVRHYSFSLILYACVTFI